MRSSPSSAKTSSAKAAAFESKALSSLQNIADLASDQPAVIGVSGGRDSVALLHFFVTQRWRNLTVAHFNHGLRGRESGQDAAFVRRLANRYDLPCVVCREDIAAFAAAAKLSTETAARERRDVFFQAVARQAGTRFVFLAHHTDDNAETILGNLLRGAALQGVVGMEQVATFGDDLLKIRPLLDVRREELDAYAQAHSLKHREDSSNLSQEHRRNRLRHEVLPLLNEVLQRDVTPVVARFGRLAARDEDYLQSAALELIERFSLIQPDDTLKVVSQLREAHPAISTRIVRQWLVTQLGLRGIGNHELEQVLEMLKPEGPAKINLPHDRHLRRKAKRLFLEPVS